MDASALVGSLLADKYRVESIVGEGGMGVVLAARHLELEENVAIKVLNEEASRDAATVARFMREAKASARIRSDHVVRVRDVGRLPDGRPFMVMELLEGLDLGQLLEQNGPLPVDVAVDYVLQASEAVGEAHALGIVHRDLKPSNLFLTRRRNGKPCVKVLDFGISKLLGAEDVRKTSTKQVFGSPLYMSPEQLVSTADVDARADVWSMAVVLFELLTGRTPFLAPSLAELHVAILQHPAPDVRTRRPDVPAPVAEAISRALAKSREERIGSLLALATALVPFASPVGREAFDALKATAEAPRPPAPSWPSGSMPVVAAAAGAAPPSSPRPVDGDAALGAATQKTFTTRSWPRGKGGLQPSVVVALAIFGLLGLVGASAIASSLLLGRRAPTEPSVASTSAPAEPPAEATSTPEPDPPPEAPPPATVTTASASATASSTPRPTTKPTPPVASTRRRKLPDDRR